MSNTISSARSYLFVPANREDFVAKAASKGADIIVLDLEDSIPIEQKPIAREKLASNLAQLRSLDQAVGVRLNADLANMAADLAAIDFQAIDCLLLPKAESASVINLIVNHISELEKSQGLDYSPTQLVAMIETCKGLLNIREIANAHSRISALALGSEDLSAELGVSPNYDSLLYICQQIAIAAGEAQIAALGFPGSIGEFSDREQLSDWLATAKNLGFSGALCIHPVQAALVNHAFSYNDTQRQWAIRVVEAMEKAQKQGLGACQLEGKMLDAPVLALAQKIIAQTS